MFETYDSLFSTFYYIYTVFGVISNVFLLFLIIKKSPKELKNYKIIIADTCVSQLLASATALFTQIRIIPSGKTMVLVYLGPCGLISIDVCRYSYALMLGCIKNALLTTSFSMTCRYVMMKNKLKLTRKRMFGICALVGIIPVVIVSLTIQLLIPLTLCSLPVVMYIYIQYTGTESTFVEYLIFILICLPPAINPAITIYYMAPYRKWVVNTLRPESCKSLQSKECSVKITVIPSSPTTTTFPSQSLNNQSINQKRNLRRAATLRNM